jgi:hypothetical protein
MFSGRQNVYYVDRISRQTGYLMVDKIFSRRTELVGGQNVQ